MTEIPEAAHRARQMYADGATVAAIKAATNLTGHAIYFWLDGGPGESGPVLKPLVRRVVRSRKVTAGDRLTMIGRIMRGCDRQISEIEQRINPSPTQMDQDSRRLAMISRTLNELTAIDERNREIKRKKAPRENERQRPSASQDIPPTSMSFDDLLRDNLMKLSPEGGAMLSGGSE